MIAVEGPQVAIAFLTLRTWKVTLGRVSGDVRLSYALCDLIEERIERRIVNSGVVVVGSPCQLSAELASKVVLYWEMAKKSYQTNCTLPNDHLYIRMQLHTE
jgi:hypothetical protein